MVVMMEAVMEGETTVVEMAVEMAVETSRMVHLHLLSCGFSYDLHWRFRQHWRGDVCMMMAFRMKLP